MSEAQASLEDMISHASGLIAAAIGKIKIRAAMRLVYFTSVQVETMSLYQRIRRKSQQMVVVDKRSVERPAIPLPQVNICSGDTVASILSSTERTNTNGDSSNDTGIYDDEDDNNNTTVAPTPRHLLATNNAEENNVEVESTSNRKRSPDESSINTGSSKKSRRSSKEVHRLQAHVIMQTKKDCTTMKVATTRIATNNKLADGHPDKKSMNKIVEEVNVLCGSNLSPKTVGRYILKGLINVSPMKRGPAGSFPRNTFVSLKWAYASYLQLEQAEGKTQSSIKDMTKRINACVNAAGFVKSRDDLTRKLRNETANLFTVGKTNVMEF